MNLNHLDKSGFTIAASLLWGKVTDKFSALARVAHSGKYLDLTGRPTKLSDFENDAGYKTTDNNTWKANTKDQEGYVPKGSGNGGKFWGTDSQGNPGWKGVNISDVGNLQEQIESLSTQITDVASKAGYPLANVTNLSVKKNNGSLTLTWTDPANVVFNGEKKAEYAGTKVLRKTGSYSTSETDGTLVVDSKTKNQYKTTGFTDKGLTNGTTYYYTLFPYTKKNIYTMSDKDKISGVPEIEYNATFANNTWTQIANASKEGKAKTLWKIGDTKEVADGFICRIVGFDHDDLADGSGKAGITLFFYYPLQMALNNTTSQYFIVYPALSNVSSGVQQIKNVFPSELSSAVKKVTKKYNRGTSVTSVDNYNIDVFLPSASELKGTDDGTGTQYEGFKNNSYLSNWNIFWTRTGSWVIDNGSSQVKMCYIGIDGTLQTRYRNENGPVFAPCFCI